MSNAWAGLGSGIERGFRLGAMVDDQARTREQHKQQMELSRLQIETLKDQNKREKLRRENQGFLHSLRSFKDDPEGYSAALQENPKLAKRVLKHMTNVGDFAFADTGKAGDVKFQDLEPMGETDAGPVFAVKVINKDGEESYITENREGLSDGDQPWGFTLDELTEEAMSLDELINSVEAGLIELGDMGPVQRRRAAEATAAERAYQEQQAAIKHRRAKELAGIKAGKKNQPKVISEDPNTGERQYGIYDEATNSFIPVDMKESPEVSGAAFSRLPSDQQRAMAVESLQQQNVPPQESTYFGLGDDIYSEQQIAAEIGRLSTGASATKGLGTVRQEGEVWKNSKGQTVMLVNGQPMIMGRAKLGKVDPNSPTSVGGATDAQLREAVSSSMQGAGPTYQGLIRRAEQDL